MQRTTWILRYHVRRRALLAFRALSAHDPELVKRIIPKVQKRLKDSESSVVGAALLVSADVVGANSVERIYFPCSERLGSVFDHK